MAKILLVEDDINLREIYAARLTAEGHEVAVASDGEEALSKAIAQKPLLILLDVMMPKISGFDVLDILRQTPETKNVKVIMLTALSQDSDRERGERLGVDKYLVKSQTTLEDVVTTVKSLLSDQPGALPSQEASSASNQLPPTSPDTSANDTAIKNTDTDGSAPVTSTTNVSSAPPSTAEPPTLPPNSADATPLTPADNQGADESVQGGTQPSPPPTNQAKPPLPNERAHPQPGDVFSPKAPNNNK